MRSSTAKNLGHFKAGVEKTIAHYLDESKEVKGENFGDMFRRRVRDNQLPLEQKMIHFSMIMKGWKEQGFNLYGHLTDSCLAFEVHGPLMNSLLTPDHYILYGMLLTELTTSQTIHLLGGTLKGASQRVLKERDVVSLYYALKKFRAEKESQQQPVMKQAALITEALSSELISPLISIVCEYAAAEVTAADMIADCFKFDCVKFDDLTPSNLKQAALIKDALSSELIPPLTSIVCEYAVDEATALKFKEYSKCTFYRLWPTSTESTVQSVATKSPSFTK